MKNVSVCVPTYGMKGKGAFYLQKNLSSIFMQHTLPYEIVISDHSADDDDSVRRVAESWSKYLNIRYWSNPDNVGSIASNLNNCVEKSSGDIVDFLLQDDYYFGPTSLEQRVQNLGNKQWGLTSTLHYSMEQSKFYWHLVPAWRSDIYLGFNSIGSPSLLTMLREGAPKFDDRLFMLTDCDYFKQLYDKYGPPPISNSITIITCMWEGQSQKDVSTDRMSREQAIVKEKYEKHFH